MRHPLLLPRGLARLSRSRPHRSAPSRPGTPPPSVRILRGGRRRLEAECRRLAAECGPSAVLSPTRARPWHGVLTLLEALPAWRSAGEIESLRREHSAVLARIPGSPGRLRDDGADGARSLMAARTLSHLSHNFLLQKPLFEGLADAVHAAAAGVTLIVPDLAILDRESVGLLRTLYRRHPGTAPSLVVGFDPDRQTPEPDADGLIWELRLAEVWRVILGWLTLPGAEAVDLPRVPGAPAAPAGPHGDLDPTPSDPETALAAVRAAFESFAFEFTIRAGLALIAGGAPSSGRERAEVHGLVALAAHNRQFRSLGNDRLARFLCQHLGLAFEAEDRPEERSAVSYRLAVAYGRRLKDRPNGLLWSERAIEEARRLESSGGNDSFPAADRAILEAWGRNIKSFMLTGTGRLADAARECERAYRELDRALVGESAPLQSPRAAVREASFSRSILADNLGAIYQMSGDRGKTRTWKETSDRHNREVPEVERYEARFWIATYRRQHRLDAARERAERGLLAARREHDALREYRYGVELADLCYRLRDAAGALTHYADAEQLYRRLGSPSFLRPTRLAPAAAAARSGSIDEALRRIDASLADLSPDRTVARAQGLALRGLSLARVGRAVEAESDLDGAIDLAVEIGERDLLLSVAISAGRACQILGRDGDARAAYAQALALLGGDGPSAEDRRAAPPGLELAAWLGFLETGGSSDAGECTETVAGPSESARLSGRRRALSLVDGALADAETWWRLPRLLAELEGSGGAPLDDFQVDRLRLLIT
ncbi:MAG: hypothetical protein AAGM22_23065 [Acidobacteriota bacterium]